MSNMMSSIRSLFVKWWRTGNVDFRYTVICGSAHVRLAASPSASATEKKLFFTEKMGKEICLPQSKAAGGSSKYIIGVVKESEFSTKVDVHVWGPANIKRIILELKDYVI